MIASWIDVKETSFSAPGVGHNLIWDADRSAQYQAHLHMEWHDEVCGPCAIYREPSQEAPDWLVVMHAFGEMTPHNLEARGNDLEVLRKWLHRNYGLAIPAQPD